MKKFSLFILSLLFCTGYMSGADWNVYVARYKQDKACAISYTFDDGLAEHYTLVAPQLEKRGFRGTFYNRQIKKFPTEKQNVSLKHILT